MKKITQEQQVIETVRREGGVCYFSAFERDCGLLNVENKNTRSKYKAHCAGKQDVLQNPTWSLGIGRVSR